MPFILAVDYDSTLFSGSFPQKGDPIQEVIDKVKEFKRHGAQIALWTCREGKSLQEAIQRCEEVGLVFDAVNSNVPAQIKYMKAEMDKGNEFATRKIFADFYVDDRSMNIEIFLKIDVEETCKRFADRV